MKICTTCKQEKPISEYYKKQKTLDGYAYVCKECTAAYYRAYNIARTAAEAVSVPQSKTCRDCGLEKPISQFGKKNNVPDKHNIYCKPCWRIRCSIADRKYYGRKKEASRSFTQES